MAPEIKKTPAIMTPSRGINNIKLERRSSVGTHIIQDTSKQINFIPVSYLKKTFTTSVQIWGNSNQNRTWNILTHSLPLGFQEKLTLHAKHCQYLVWFYILKLIMNSWHFNFGLKINFSASKMKDDKNVDSSALPSQCLRMSLIQLPYNKEISYKMSLSICIWRCVVGNCNKHNCAFIMWCVWQQICYNMKSIWNNNN